MTALTIRLPNSVHQKVKDLAQRDEVSINQFIASAVSEKMAVVLTLDYLRNEAANARREDFLRFLDAAGREELFAATQLQRALERALDPQGLSTTAHAVLARLRGG